MADPVLAPPRPLPRLLSVALGVVCVGLGVVLVANPFRSLSVLAWLVGVGLLLTGVGEVLGMGETVSVFDRVAGVVWIGAGLLALAWPGITIVVLAITAGVSLVVGGLLKLVAATMGRTPDRLLDAIGAMTSIVVGAIALTWPAITVFALAVIFGVRTVFLGLRLIVAYRRGDGPSLLGRLARPIRFVAALTALAVVSGAAVVSAAVHTSGPDAPGAFYSAPDPLPAGPLGTVIRSEVIDGFRAGATTYRVLYKSTGFKGNVTAVSGLVVVPDGPAPADGRNVVAFTHGTVGVATNCSPSNLGAPWGDLMEGLDPFIAAGYVVAGTDYQGLGTLGPHPYLVGAVEGMNELDMVRAAHNLAKAHAGTTYAVWGHSQGGHAALFTGQLAASYAPELHLVGVAAGAPVPDLVDLFKVNVKTTIGKVLISMALQSWEQVYDAAALDQIVTPAARPVVARVAENCLYDQRQILASVPGSLALGLTFLSNPPWETEPWKSIVASNNPGGTRINAPLLITQGANDPIVDPAVTAAFVARECAAGEVVRYVTLPGVQHVDAGFKAVDEVVPWLADRFAGKVAPSTC